MKPTPKQRKQARHYAVQALYLWHFNKKPLSQIEAEFRVDYDFSDTDIEYFHEVFHGVPAHLDELDELITANIDRKLDELDPVSLAILRLGSYELAHRFDVPFKAVIDESVSLAKKFGATDSFKYINGVLDKVASKVRVIEVNNK